MGTITGRGIGAERRPPIFNRNLTLIQTLIQASDSNEIPDPGSMPEVPHAR